MVGVAGKSKGCGTCRRRRVKCDEAKPKCTRCQRAKLDCAGYDRYPVFITRTQEGYRKRAPLEEIKRATKPAIISLPSPDLEATRIVCWFWESFSRSPPSQYALQSPSHWLDNFTNWPSLLLPLRQAFLAVAVTRLAKSTRRPEVLQAGRRIYTQSLASQQKALANPAVVLKDDVLAASCAMVLYELFDPTENKLDAWLQHLDGVCHVLQRRGPHMHGTATSRAILEHGRYLLMFQHLNSRTACFLSEGEWLSAPWKGQKKSIEQTVFDNGLQLAGVFERCDAAKEQETSAADLEALLNACLEVFRCTDQLLQDSILPVIEFDLVELPGEPSDSLIVRNPAALLLSITALGIKLGACESALQVSSLLEERVLAAGNTSYSSKGGVTSPEMWLLSETGIVTANQIAQFVKTCLTQRVGSMGAARMMFALKVALRQFDPDSLEFQQGTDMLMQLKGHDHQFAALATRAKTTSRAPLKLENAGLVQGNSTAIAERWERLSSVSPKTSSRLDPGICKLPEEAVASWADWAEPCSRHSSTSAVG